MEENSRLTIIIPTFNEEKTIESVLGRVFECLPNVHEVLVVDDASRDGTAALCRKFADREPRVRLLSHAINQGKTAALRTAFSHMQGDIVVVQDADME
jgi:glycosyltransferase involved in cell wall biosynthesis